MKIYRIISDNSDGRFLCYIGCTKKELKSRLNEHNNDYLRYLKGQYHWITSFELIKKNWYEIVLVEDLGDCSKSYCLDKEAYYINHYKGLSDEYLVVNKCNPNCLDNNNRKEWKKTYLQSEKFRENLKTYRQSEKFKEYRRQYYLKKK